MPDVLTIADLRREYLARRATPVEVIDDIFARVEREGLSPIWISLADRDEARRRAATIDVTLPLAGIPFAVKDNIDVEGMPTTAGCPAYAYRADRSATVVTRLLDAGAILVGKTNMDQFATGLVGTRSPYGACRNAFDSNYISGGSSSGSAVALAKGLCAFSLGTDTAGSGRIPAAFNNLVGLKPTRGVLSMSGVVPACRSLDCVSIFAADIAGARLVWQVAQGFDARDPYSRASRPDSAASRMSAGSFRFGVPAESALEFFDDAETPVAYREAIHRFERIGGVPVEIDFTPFREAADLLYGPWVAERFAAVGDFIGQKPQSVHPVVRDIILSGAKYRAADAFHAAHRLEVLKQQAMVEWQRIDVLVLPTAGTIYTTAAVEADPVRLNTRLGYYTNFVNLMDLAAVALPAGFRSDGLPFGVSIVGNAFSDWALMALAQRFRGEEAGEASHPRSVDVQVAVVGAHLTGEPLNFQLTDRHARLVKTCRTAHDYRLFALAGTVPSKPGLVREPDYSGPGIEVEVWAMAEELFGGFVRDVPPPLAIGNVRLDSGETVKGFVCEPRGLDGATEITSFGGWRNYLNAGRVFLAGYDLLESKDDRPR
jgi:allophanate hydrolase